MAMTFLQISAFREVMRLGSITEAARSLGRTQPAISAQIKALESALQCKLFERRGKRLVPMPEAFYLLREADSILENLNVVERNMKNLRHQVSGDLTIISMPGPTVEFLPNIVSEFLVGRPEVNVSIISRTSPQVEQMMATQNYDIGLADAVFSGMTDTSVLNHQIFDYPCYCAVAAADPLAKKSIITPYDLDGQNLGYLNEDHPSTVQLHSVFDAAGVTFKRRFETRYFVPLYRFIEKQQCYGVVDALARQTYNMLHGENSAISFVRFEPRISLKVSLMTPKHRPLSQLAEIFKSVLETELEKLVD